MHHNDDFEDYLLKHNILNVTSLETLYKLENDITYQKSLILKKNPIPGEFDYAHLKKIHHFLFEDIYDFAGMDRFELGVEHFGKGNSKFILGSDIPKWEKIIFDELQEKNHLLELNYQEFYKELAALFANINALHPFREGNGRTQRVFIMQLANKAGYEIDFTKVSQLESITAAKDSMFNKLKKMENMFQKIIVKI